MFFNIDISHIASLFYVCRSLEQASFEKWFEVAQQLHVKILVLTRMKWAPRSLDENLQHILQVNLIIISNSFCGQDCFSDKYICYTPYTETLVNTRHQQKSIVIQTSSLNYIGLIRALTLTTLIICYFLSNVNQIKC